MILDIVSILLILSSVVVLANIVGKRMKVVASIKVDALPQEQQADVRKRLLRDKLDRKMAVCKKWVKHTAKPMAEHLSRIGEFWNTLHRKLAFIRTHKKHIDTSTQVSPDPLFVAYRALEAEQFDEAEKCFIEVIRLDPRCHESYRGLSDLYLRKKDLALAYESLQYLWKLLKNKGDDAIPMRFQTAYDLWDVSFQLDKLEQAKKWIQEVLELGPNNPKFLDAALETYIALKDRLRAERVLETLQATNPENNKLAEFAERIKALSY